MTNKNDSAELVRIRINQKKLDALDPTTRPADYEVGTLEDGTIIIKLRATKPRSE